MSKSSKGRQSPRTTGPVLRILAAANPWWTSGAVPAGRAPPFRRREFALLRSALESPLITGLAGPRQVGKTTLMYQLIDDALHRGFDPRRILFVAMDFPGISRISEDPISSALEAHEEAILASPYESTEDRVLVLLDEVTKVELWHETLKGWYDRRLPLKFVVSDSSATGIRRGLSESLIGRCTVDVLLPMRLAEVAAFHDPRPPWEEVALGLRGALVRSVKRRSPSAYFAELMGARNRLAPWEGALLRRFREYLLKDGYPELLHSEDWDWCARRLREYCALVFARDLLRHYEVRDTKALDSLVGLLADQPGQRFDLTTVARAIGVSVPVAREYLSHLESVFVASSSEFYASSRMARMRKQKKLYISNVGLGNALSGRLGVELLQDTGALGRVVETAVRDHCERLVSDLEPGRAPKVYYWRNYRGQEVDVVVPLAGVPVPVEVKHQPRVTDADTRPVVDFLEAHPTAPFGVVVTKDTLERRGRVVLVPAPLFMLGA